MELNVVYSSDDDYCRHLLVSMISLLVHNQEFNDINLYILSNGILEKNRKLLQETGEQYSANICFIEFDSIKQKIYTDGKFPCSCFGRLFLDDVLPLKRVIYLDCDSVINGSLRELLETDLGDDIVGAVQDTVPVYFKRVIGLDKNDIYYNTGMLLIDLKKWKEARIQEKVIRVIARFHGSVPHQDQGVLNCVCAGKIKRLHPKYNLLCPMFEYTPEELQTMNPNYYSSEELQEAIASPIFIHFTEGFSNRPWREGCTHPYADLYRKYQSMTPFADRIERKVISRHSTIAHAAYKIFPFSLYRFFCYCVQLKEQIKEM